MVKIQNNLTIVLKRLIDLAGEDEYFAEEFAEGLEELLDQIAMDDGFGTERQSDPRGDFREKDWSILGEIQ